MNKHPFKSDSSGRYCETCGGRSSAPEHAVDVPIDQARHALMLATNNVRNAFLEEIENLEEKAGLRVIDRMDRAVRRLHEAHDLVEHEAATVPGTKVAEMLELQAAIDTAIDRIERYFLPLKDPRRRR